MLTGLWIGWEALLHESQAWRGNGRVLTMQGQKLPEG